MEAAGSPVSLERCSRRTSAAPPASARRRRTRASDRRALLPSISLSIPSLMRCETAFRYLLCSGFGLPKAAQTLLPLRQLGIAQHGVLNDLIALVFGVQGANDDVGLRGVNEVFQRGINKGRLGVHVEKRRGCAFEAERKPIGPSNSGSRIQLGNVAIAQFAVAGGGVLFVGGSDTDASGVFQGQFDCVVERDGFGQQGGGRERSIASKSL